MKSDYKLGLEFILANKKLIIDQCSGPSEKHVVEKSFEMLSCGGGEVAAFMSKWAWDQLQSNGFVSTTLRKRGSVVLYADGNPEIPLYTTPPTPSAGVEVPAWVPVMKALVAHIERETCPHEETHRGGAIWEICDQCGDMWADDRGGKPEFKWPKCVEDARAITAALERGGSDD